MHLCSRIVLIVALAFAFIPSSASAQDTDSNDTGDQPRYPGIPPRSKVEGTLGNYNLRVYGTVLLNIHAADSPRVGGEVPLWGSPSSIRTTFPDGTSERVNDVHDLFFTARQSVFGFMVKPADSSAGAWKTSGKLEFDFFGTDASGSA